MRKLLIRFHKWRKRRYLEDLHSSAAIGWTQALVANDKRRQDRMQQIMSECEELLGELE